MLSSVGLIFSNEELLLVSWHWGTRTWSHDKLFWPTGITFDWFALALLDPIGIGFAVIYFNWKNNKSDFAFDFPYMPKKNSASSTICSAWPISYNYEGIFILF